jgi:glycosyltransferase 2 family protein
VSAGEMPPAGGQPRAVAAHPALRATRYALTVAAVVFVALALARSWGDVQAYDWSLSPAWLVVSALAMLLFYGLQAFAWWLLLRLLAVHAPLRWSSATWGRSMLARYIPGNVFMVLDRVLSSQRRGLELRRVSAAMVYEQALPFCAALVTTGILLPFWDYRRGVTALSLIAIPVLLVLLHPRFFVPLADRLLRAVGREPLGVELRFRRVLALLCYYVGGWFVAGFACWALARGVSDVAADALPEVTAAFAFAYVVGMVAFVFPGGLGVREVVLAGALGGTLGTGVALAWAVLLRLWQIGVELCFVGLATVAARTAPGGRVETGDAPDDGTAGG